MSHIREEARPEDADVVIFGHSHEPLIETVGRTLWFNPGSAVPGRFRLPVTLGLPRIEDGEADAEIDRSMPRQTYDATAARWPSSRPL